MKRLILWIISTGLVAGCYAQSPTPTATVSPTASPSPTASASPTPTATPTASPTGMPVRVSNPDDQWNERDMSGALYATASGPFGAFQSLESTIPTNFYAQRRYALNPTAGYVITGDAAGNETWTSPTQAVAPGLLGPPFTVEAGPTLTPQIQANIAGASQVAFANFHNVATDTFGSYKYNAGAYRGAIGAMDFLDFEDEILNISPLVPYGATTWVGTPVLRVFAGANHSAGVYPVSVSLGATGEMELVAAGVLGMTGTDGIFMASNEAINMNAAGGVIAQGPLSVDDLTTITAGDIYTDDDIEAGGSITADGAFISSTGFVMSGLTAGFDERGFFLDSAAGDAISGTATLVGGTATVATGTVGPNTLIFLTRNTPGGTIGDLSAPTASITINTSFVINSTSATDTSTVNWFTMNNQ